MQLENFSNSPVHHYKSDQDSLGQIRSKLFVLTYNVIKKYRGTFSTNEMTDFIILHFINFGYCLPDATKCHEVKSPKITKNV